ncbi:HotDog domain-containing protein [Epithele typhae]|uniref:HotDog domain-containing protein n=1 Tax=Epithele typhae TaxID=378194 RepID=UPI0020086C57|nr:HotDog domain-containing protein [Epithele typhae]KAH9918573.1 HotDog domain-containing protein [Epithele typhae]
MAISIDQLVLKGDIVQPPAVQARIRDYLTKIFNNFQPFASEIALKLLTKELELYTRDGDGKPHAKLTFEIVVDPSMINGHGAMHGGCAVFLIDTCSSSALAILAMHLEKPWNHVSQTLNTTFHAPMPVGATLHIINVTQSLGSRTVSVLTEIWDVTNHRLCVSAVHNKMAPSSVSRL